MGFKNEIRAVVSLRGKNTKKNEGNFQSSSALLLSEKYGNTMTASERNAGK